MEDEERSHRGDTIGRAGDQCSEERKNQKEMKKITFSEPEVMIDFSRARFFFFFPGNFNNMLLI